MRKRLVLALLTAGVLAVGSTANAGIVYTPVPPDYNFGIGVFDPSNPGVLNTAYITSNSIGPSDTFVLTFAAHMKQIPYFTQSLHFNLQYDNSVVQVLHAQPKGNWTSNNYASSIVPWPNPSSGITTNASLFQSVGTGSTFIPMSISQIVPFFQVTGHIKPGPASDRGFMNIVAMTLVSHLSPLLLTPGQFDYFGADIHRGGKVIPEPATGLLLVAGLAVCGGRLLGRRRYRRSRQV